MRMRGEDQEWEVSQLQFLDDTALMADSEEKLSSLARKSGRVCKRRNLRLNVGYL